MVHKVLPSASGNSASRCVRSSPRNPSGVYPLFAGVGGSFGYWLQGVESRQLKMLAQRREAILEKRRRRDEKPEGGVLAAAS
ncbi:NADH-ubiquinone oxidoreductase 14 kDa subunit [Penicillium expansum]|nr:NADH-ubiquinone oxidoreductase 14 kDa subunit [Penicillium expansum]